VNDRDEVIVSTAIGVIVGGLAGYLVLTRQGRSVLAGLNSATDEALGAVQGFRRTLRAMDDIIAEAMLAMEDARREYPLGANRDNAAGGARSAGQDKSA
jgi:uncharacterized membrane protein